MKYFSPETRLKMSLAHLGKPNANKGKKIWSDKPHPLLGKNAFWVKKGPQVSKNCLNCSNLFEVPPCLKEKKYCSRRCCDAGLVRVANSGSFKKGMRPWQLDRPGTMKGVPHPKMKQYRGENHWSWKGGMTMWVKKNERGDSGYQAWMKSVKKREENKCRLANENCFGHTVAHHILPWRDYPEERYNINNGITLCQHHHPRKRVDEERSIPILQELVVLKKS